MMLVTTTFALTAALILSLLAVHDRQTKPTTFTTLTSIACLMSTLTRSGAAAEYPHTELPRATGKSGSMANVIDNFKMLSFVQRLIMLRQSASDYGRAHPRTTMLARAHAASVDFIETHMPDAIGFDTPKELLSFAVTTMTLPGQVLEFGVNAGGTIRHLAKLLPDRSIHGFDSFEGLPEAWSGNNLAAGAFSRGGKLPKVPANVSLHKGWFNETLPGFAASHLDPIAFLHVDCDIYASTKTIFDELASQIVPGTVIVFDEFFNYPNWQAHEYRAFTEFLAARGLACRYTGYAYEQVACVIIERGAEAGAVLHQPGSP